MTDCERVFFTGLLPDVKLNLGHRQEECASHVHVEWPGRVRSARGHSRLGEDYVWHERYPQLRTQEATWPLPFRRLPRELQVSKAHSRFMLVVFSLHATSAEGSLVAFRTLCVPLERWTFFLRVAVPASSLLVCILTLF